MNTYWSLPSDLLRESIAIMRPHGRIGNEGLALWFGSVEGSCAKITHVVEVHGPGFQTTPLYMSLSLRAMTVLMDLAEQIDSCLVGQIHSHPNRLLDLSELDRVHGIRSLNYLSVVCPYYAQRDIGRFDECGVHVFENFRYRRMQPDEVAGRLVISNALVTSIRCEVPA